MITIGILSTARINIPAMLRPVQKRSDCKVIAIASRDQNRAKQYARSHHIPKAYGTYQALLDDPEIQAVYISTPNALHDDWVEQALNAGKHILCEKPLVTHLHRAQYMKNIALKKNLLLMEAMHYRYHPALISFFKIIKKGFLGKIHFIHSSLRYYRPTLSDDIRLSAALKGGSLMHLGCYCLDAITQIVEKPFIFKSLQVLKYTNLVDLACQAQLITLDKSIQASFYCDFSGHTFDSEIEVKGQNGYMRLQSALGPTTFSPHNVHDTFKLQTNIPKGFYLNPGNGLTTYDFQLAHFMKKIQLNDLSPEINEACSSLLEEADQLVSLKFKNSNKSNETSLKFKIF